MPEKRQLTIVGLGAMGGSYAQALAGQGYRLTAIDRDAATIHWALQQGLIEQGVVSGPLDSSLSLRSAAELKTLLGAADGVILGLYPQRILPWLRVYRGLFKPGVIVTDMAPVKGGFLEEAQQLMPPGCEFIASHPMVGLDKAGVRHADAGLFRGANFIVVPTAENSEAGVRFARRLGRALGFAAVTTLNVEEHDRLTGYVSQMPRALAVCLLAGTSAARLPRVKANAYHNLVGIADLNTELWEEILMANTPQLTRQIGEMIDSLGELRRRLANGDREGLRRLLESGRQNSRRFTGEEMPDDGE